MLHKYSYTGISTICKTNKITWHIKSFSYEKRKNYDYKVKFANWQNNCSCIHIYIVEARSEQFGVKSTYANQHVNVVYFLFFHMNKHQRLLKWKLSDDSSTVVYL